MEICDETLLTPPQVKLDAACPTAVVDDQQRAGLQMPFGGGVN